MNIENEAPLKVLMVHIDPCIRVLKEAQALCKKKVIIDVLCLSLTNTPQLQQHVRNIHIVSSLDDLHHFLQQRHQEWDIIHCHNEPNSITVIALNACRMRPVIYDCHDMTSARSPLQGDGAIMEKACFTHSQGVVHVSDALKGLAFSKYGPSLTIVLPSFPLACESKVGAHPKLAGIHIVYQGSIVEAPVVHYSYRFYLPMFQELLAAGVHVHIYPSAHAAKQPLSAYRQLDAKNPFFHLHDFLPYDALIAEMSRYQWGFSGFNTAYITNADTINFLNSALPNKFFDYLLAGVCPVVINNSTTAAFATRHNVGYSAENMKAFTEICTTKAPLPPLADGMAAIDMDTQIYRLLGLYHAVRSQVRKR